jgi:hypothetical protein
MALAHDADMLPLRIEDISTGWLTAALSGAAPGVAVEGFEVLNVRHGFTTVVRLRLGLNAAGRAAGLPEVIMLKAGFERFTRDLAGDYSIFPFAMEVGSYEELPALGLNMPKCWFARFSQERQQMAILMEDLTLRGVTFCAGLTPVSAEEVRRRLTSLAAFHARTWDSPEIKPGGRYERFPPNGVAMFLDYMHHAGFYASGAWEKHVGLPRGAAVSSQFHDLDWMTRAMEHMAQLSDSLPNVLVHGDTHLGNLYFEPDGTPGFFDSLPRREAPMIEVAYHIANALDPAVRRACDRDLVAHYREELIRHGVAAPSLDELMRQFAAFLPYGYITFLINQSDWQTESFNTAHTGRYNVAMLDHGVRGLVDAATGR